MCVWLIVLADHQSVLIFCICTLVSSFLRTCVWLIVLIKRSPHQSVFGNSTSLFVFVFVFFVIEISCFQQHKQLNWLFYNITSSVCGNSSSFFALVFVFVFVIVFDIFCFKTTLTTKKSPHQSVATLQASLPQQWCGVRVKQLALSAFRIIIIIIIISTAINKQTNQTNKQRWCGGRVRQLALSAFQSIVIIISSSFVSTANKQTNKPNKQIKQTNKQLYFIYSFGFWIPYYGFTCHQLQIRGCLPQLCTQRIDWGSPVNLWNDLPNSNFVAYQDGKGKDSQGDAGGGSLWKLTLGSARQVIIIIYHSKFILHDFVWFKIELISISQ